MPEKNARARAARAKRAGKSPSTQAGEFVHEEIEHVRQGKHGARSPQQAIAIGLAKARRAGVKAAPPKKGEASKATRKSAERDIAAGTKGSKKKSTKRSKAASDALKRESKAGASKQALSRQSKSSAKKRSSSARSAAAKKGAQTKGPQKRSQAAKKAARTRAKKGGSS